MNKFKPTDEQISIVEAFKSGDNLCIEAYAGASKTYTLKLLADSIPDEKFVYLAFNKSIAEEAKQKFGKNTICRTVHSFAFQAIGKKYADRLNGPRVSARQTASILRIPRAFEIAPTLWLSETKVAMLARGTVTRFCYSDDIEITEHHVPYINGAEFMNDLRKYVVPFAKKIWEDAQLIDGRLQFQHDFYLKMFSLTDPILPGHVILGDEFQDTNPCVGHIFQIQKNAQRICCGDKFQQIFAWRGAKDYLEIIGNQPGVRTLHLSQSFRFGDAIANEANKWLTQLGATIPLRGFDKIDSEVCYLSDPYAIICRTNAQVIVEALHAAHPQGINSPESGLDSAEITKFPVPNIKKYAIVGGTNEIKRFAEAAADLQAGRGCNHPDLMAFQNWGQVREFVKDEATDLKTIVSLIDSHGPEIVMQIANNAVDEHQADVIISTCHKIKGKEFDSVKIAADFVDPRDRTEEGEAPSLDSMKAEFNLCYVAVTRASNKLDCESVGWIDGYKTAND